MLKLSIITINFNNAAGLQKTMDSVFVQDFHDYEYIVIDGGSTDGSGEIMERYSDRLSYRVSEKDNGIYHAMNKGIVRCKGEYILFLNSGDYLYSDNILKDVFSKEAGEDIIYGDAMVDRGNAEKNEVKTYPKKLTFSYFITRTLHHTSAFIKADLFKKWGLYNEEFKIMSDWEFFIKVICLYQATYKYQEIIISCFDPHGISSLIESGEQKQKERQVVLDKYFAAFLPQWMEMEAEQKKLAARLSLYQSSRLHRIAESIIDARLYKFFKGTG